MKRTDIERYEGLAVSGLLAIATGVLMTGPQMSPTYVWYLWLVFVVACGLSISPPSRITAAALLRVGAPAAACLLVTLLARGAVSILANGAYVALASMPPQTPAEVIKAQALTKIAILYALIFVGTVPAVVLASFARGVLWASLRALWRTDPEQVGRLEKTINTIVRIAVLLGGAYLVRT